jgi:hypothetical protein
VKPVVRALVLVACVIGGGAAPRAASAQTPSEKNSRTPAQRKIDSTLLFEIYRKQGKAAEKHVPPGKTGVRIDSKSRALVDVRAEVTPALQKKVRELGGTIDSTSAEYRSIVAWVPLLKLEQLARDPAVISIIPKPEAAIR